MYAQASITLNQSAASQERHRHQSLYQYALNRGRRARFWSWLPGRSRCLLDLQEIEANCRIQARSSAGLRTVPIEQICGSEGRSGDFDRDFNPLQERTRERWLSIAAARQRGKSLPPVSLVQVGDRYFVTDGHHRISVARTLGQQTVEAQVTVWQVEGRLPWEIPAAAGELVLQPA